MKHFRTCLTLLSLLSMCAPLALASACTDCYSGCDGTYYNDMVGCNDLYNSCMNLHNPQNICSMVYDGCHNTANSNDMQCSSACGASSACTSPGGGGSYPWDPHNPMDPGGINPKSLVPGCEPGIGIDCPL